MLDIEGVEQPWWRKNVDDGRRCSSKEGCHEDME